MSMLKPLFPVLLLALAVPMMSPASLLAEEADAEKPVHCLSLPRIKDSEIISRKYIVFRMRDGAAYVNVLKHPCPGLSRHKTIMYRTSIGQLCDLDIITVLDDVGFGLTPGASCGLGNFELIDEEGIANLKEGVKSGRL